MKLITYQLNGVAYIGAVTEKGVIDLTAVAPTMLQLIEMEAAGLAQAQAVIDRAQPVGGLDDVTLLAPIPTPRRNLMCVGRNYLGHAEESFRARGQKLELPDYPLIFSKATTTVIGPTSDIPYNAAVSSQIDWEAELGVIIGRAGKGLRHDNALDYVWGYTVLNDVTARDIQNRHKQFFLGKSLDGSCPLGPWIVTADEVPDPHNLDVICRVNGVTKQAGNTRQLIFDIPTVLMNLSLGMTLLPGDIVATGTPEGVGFARTPPEFLVPGDVVETEVVGIGRLRNRIAG